MTRLLLPLVALACGGVPSATEPAPAAPSETDVSYPAPTTKIRVELPPGREVAVPELGLTLSVLGAATGHTADGRRVTRGRVRVARGAEVQELPFERDGPFRALGYQMAVWADGMLVCIYPPGTPISP